MRRKGCFFFVGGVILGAVLAAGLTVVGLSRWLAPATFGLVPADFMSHEIDVESVLNADGDTAPLPNFVVILADDLGYGDLGVQGSLAIRTPHTDALAAAGMRFTSFYASAPVCSPSRAGLLTGRYPLRSGIITALPAAKDTALRRAARKAGLAFAQLGTVDMRGGENAVMGLPPSEITIAEALKVAGYRTCAIGKWHLGDFTELPEYHPFSHGFDEFVGFNMSNDDWPVAFWRGEEEIVEDIGIDQAHYTQIFTDEATRFIRESREKPFFLYLAHKDPHQPFFPSADFAGKSDGGPYGDAVAEFDASVGAIAAELEMQGIARKTLVIVTSDNGPWFEGSPGGLRGRKGQSYEGGFRVPFVAWWPGRIPYGAVNDTPAMNIDLLPTFLRLAGIEGPNDRIVDGADLSPVLLGRRTELPDRPLYFFHDYDVEAVRLGSWKYVDRASHYTWPVPLDKKDNFAGTVISGHNYHPPDSKESVPSLGSWPMLYQLDRDPEEAYNVAKKHPDIVSTLDAQLSAWRKDFYSNPRGWR